MYKKIGIFIIGLGVITIGTAIFLYYHAKSTVLNGLASRTIYENGETEKPETEEVADIQVEGVEFSPVNADMKVDEIKTMVNVIEIPSCDIKVPIIEGVDDYALSRGAGHFTYTAEIGAEGNASYAGHYSTVYNCIFNNLPNIKLYDDIIGYNSSGEKFVYRVISKFVTNPENVGVTNQYDGVKDLTLVTCTENGTKRLIIQARILTDEEVAEYIRESEKENRETMYKVHDSLGSIEVLEYITNRNKPEYAMYNLSARRLHELGKITDSLMRKEF